LDGDQELLFDLMGIFLDESGPLLDQVQDALVARDAAVLERAAHKLKGTVSIFRCDGAAQSALELETMGRNRDLIRAEDVYVQMQEQMEALVRSVTALVGKHAQNTARG
jgi:HPt (histidine-containing phosphotransfer) domain-containing protein